MTPMIAQEMERDAYTDIGHHQRRYKMIFTIHRGYDKSYITISTNGLVAYEAFSQDTGVDAIEINKSIKSWEKTVYIDIPSRDTYNTLVSIATYVNNELGEGFALEVD